MARQRGPARDDGPPVQQRRAPGWCALAQQQQAGTSLADRLGEGAALRVRQQRAQLRLRRLGRAAGGDGTAAR